jgi:hypothetical protein
VAGGTACLILSGKGWDGYRFGNEPCSTEEQDCSRSEDRKSESCHLLSFSLEGLYALLWPERKFQAISDGLLLLHGNLLIFGNLASRQEMGKK